ncbi:MAG: hypothetical protein Kow0090_08710 [Myxococcota bacterium]
MTTRIKTILDEIVQKIEAIQMDSDAEPNTAFHHLQGRWDIFREQANLSDRSFTINILQGDTLPDFGLQSSVENQFLLEIILCHARRNDALSQEKILGHDCEKIALTLNKLSNIGSASLVRTENFDTNRSSPHYLYTHLRILVKYSLSYNILN